MVKVRPRGKGWQYDIIFRWPDGTKFRERANAPVASKSGSQRWAEQRERELLIAGKDAYAGRTGSAVARPKTVGTTFGEFWPRVVTDHYRANRKKASTLDAAESIYKNHLGPILGTKRLVDITTAEVAALKGTLATKSRKTVNNILTVLSRSLRCAVEWGVIPAMPCKVGFFKVAGAKMEWYERHEYQRLVEAAKKCSPSIHLLVLLAGSAGLRRGEIRALKWTDLDIPRRLMHIERGIWRKHEDTPKGGRGRAVPMTPELAAALKAHRHLRERVLYSDKGRELSNRTIRNWLARAQRRAGLEANGGIHILRHTFCSHLAIAGVPAKAVQELAGHADLATTQRYMHLSPSNRSTAMAALAQYHAGSDADEGGTAEVAAG